MVGNPGSPKFSLITRTKAIGSHFASSRFFAFCRIVLAAQQGGA